MNDSTENTKAKRRPDYRVSAVAPGAGGGAPQFIRVGVGFKLAKSGGISVLCDGIALSGHLVLTGLDDELPPLEGFGHGLPQRPADFVASVGRDTGKDTFWTDIGAGYRHDTHIGVHAAVLPSAGKFVLFPNAREG